MSRPTDQSSYSLRPCTNPFTLPPKSRCPFGSDPSLSAARPLHLQEPGWATKRPPPNAVSLAEEKRGKTVVGTFSWDCGLLCLFTERRRHIEVLWRRRLLVTDDERKAKRRFLNLMRGFDTEDLDVLSKAIESGGVNIKQCAPGPPMDLIEEREESSSEEEEEEEGSEPEMMPGCSTTIVSTRPRRHSIKQMEMDRILFQRQKFPTVMSIQQQSSIVANPQVQMTMADCQRRYSRSRRASNFSSGRRCAVYQTDENGNALRPATIVMTTTSARSSESGGSVGEVAPVEEKQRRHRRQRHSPEEEDDERQQGEAARRPTIGADTGLIPQIDKPMSMPYLCCKMWRWKDLQVDAALHRLDPLPWLTINNATVSCCNPYHYGLWIKPETSSSDEQSISSGVVANGGGTMGTQYEMGDTTIGHVRTAFQQSLQAARTVNAKHVTTAESPPRTPPPAPPQQQMMGNSSDAHVGNHLSTLTNRRISHSVHHQAMSWGRLARWQRNERVGEVVTLMGQFAVIGRIAGTVFDGQDVKCAWDLDNYASFALIRQSSTDDVSESPDEVWLYNSSDYPLFMGVSRNVGRASPQLPSSIRRLSPGYCIRVHRISSGHKASQQPAADQPVVGNDLSLSPGSHRSEPSTYTLSLLTISVGIGWGVNYECKSVADLPCRYEVIFCT